MSSLTQAPAEEACGLASTAHTFSAAASLNSVSISLSLCTYAIAAANSSKIAEMRPRETFACDPRQSRTHGTARVNWLLRGGGGATWERIAHLHLTLDREVLVKDDVLLLCQASEVEIGLELEDHIRHDIPQGEAELHVAQLIVDVEVHLEK